MKTQLNEVKRNKLRRIFYFLCWLLITGADCIIGYKTALQFGIVNTYLACVWAGGFAVMSVPVKVMYDRLVETPYKQKYGTIIYLAFSCVWLLLCYKSLSGLADLRKVDLVARTNQVTLQVPILQNNIDTMQVSGKFTYALRKERLKQQVKQDSLLLANWLTEQKQRNQQERALLNGVSLDGFLWLNFLLLLSGAVCLSLAFESDTDQEEKPIEKHDFTKDYKDDTSEEKELLEDIKEGETLLNPFKVATDFPPKKIHAFFEENGEATLEEYNKTAKQMGRPIIEETKGIISDEYGTRLTSVFRKARHSEGDIAMDFEEYEGKPIKPIYHCNSCNRDFNKNGYNAHMRTKQCKPGNFTTK